MDKLSSRDKEATMIRQANRAAAVGRLMLGEIKPLARVLRGR